VVETSDLELDIFPAVDHGADPQAGVEPSGGPGTRGLLLSASAENSGLRFPMNKLFAIDWAEFFIPTHSVAEIVVRGTFMYISLFVILRFLLQRQSSAIGLADLLVVVLIADAAQDALAKGYKSVTEGVVLVLTIVFWDFAIDWLGYRFKPLAWLTRPPPLPLIEDGQMLVRNMRREMITKEELLSQIREQGLDRVDEVKSAYLEGNGEISVIKRNGETHRKRAKAR
jgi:uncharacterized membrane protein YcaP (DUF421 family)